MIDAKAIAKAKAEVSNVHCALRKCLQYIEEKLAGCEDEDAAELWRSARDTMHAANWRIVAATDKLRRAEKCQDAVDRFGQHEAEPEQGLPY